MIMTASLDFIYTKVYARSIDAMNGVYISTILSSSCTLGHSEANEDGFYLGGDLHISYMFGGRRSRYHGCGAGHWPYFGHFLTWWDRRP